LSEKTSSSTSTNFFVFRKYVKKSKMRQKRLFFAKSTFFHSEITFFHAGEKAGFGASAVGGGELN
jgi:hypothetical protein